MDSSIPLRSVSLIVDVAIANGNTLLLKGTVSATKNILPSHFTLCTTISIIITSTLQTKMKVVEMAIHLKENNAMSTLNKIIAIT